MPTNTGYKSIQVGGFVCRFLWTYGAMHDSPFRRHIGLFRVKYGSYPNVPMWAPGVTKLLTSMCEPLQVSYKYPKYAPFGAKSDPTRSPNVKPTINPVGTPFKTHL